MKHYDKLGVMLDCSREGVQTVEFVKKVIDVIAPMGYNALQLYMEDVYEVEGQPYFGYLRGKYSKEELKEIDRYAVSKGIEVMPSMQTLGHLEKIFQWDHYSYINDCGGILLIDEPKTYEFLEATISTLSECFTSRCIHINMDEAVGVGTGKYKALHGEVNRFELMCRHLKKVLEICKKYDLKPMMASDMFFHLLGNSNDLNENYYNKDFKLPDELKAMVPSEVALVYWDYAVFTEEGFEQGIINHKMFDNRIIYYAGSMCWYGFAPNISYSIRSNEIATRCCLRQGIRESYITLWGDDGKECASLASLPGLYAYAQFWQGNFDWDGIKKGFLDMFGIPFDEFMLMESPNEVNNKPIIYNDPHKYFFYQDVFLGQFDCYVQKGVEERFRKNAEKLDKWANDARFGYMFRCMASLCRALEYKASLGVRTRAAYQANDKATLQSLAENDYAVCLDRIKQFFADFKVLWHEENKSYGFETHEVRIGGLMMRIDNCRQRLLDYVASKVDSIPELTEKILDFRGAGEKFDAEVTQMQYYARIIGV